MHVLYAGDTDAQGPARYLLCILKFLKARVVYIPSQKVLEPKILKERFDAVILSDFPRTFLPKHSELLMVQQIQHGTGLLMIGGWSSFTGKNGGWRGSLIERLLPVECLKGDDRVNFSGGAVPIVKAGHEIIRGLPFHKPPMICGLNRIKVKKEGEVILAAREVLYRGRSQSPKPFLDFKEYPLLVINKNSSVKTAALMTDLAPHWCGGWVDWGVQQRILHFEKDISIEIGCEYLKFVSSLIQWFARSRL